MNGTEKLNSALSTRDVERYNADGALFPIVVLSDGEVSEFRRETERILNLSTYGSVRRLDNLHLYFEWAWRLVTNDKLLEAVGSIIGRDLLVDGSLIFHKPAFSSSYATWHQDSVYSGWHTTPSVSAWVAFSHSKPANGCMRVIPGSHRSGLREHINLTDTDNLIRRGETIEDIEASNAVDVVLEPGEMSLHHSTVIHGSLPNNSSDPRIGYIIRFVTNQSTNRNRSLTRVSGDANCDHLVLSEPLREREFSRAYTAWSEDGGATKREGSNS